MNLQVLRSIKDNITEEKLFEEIEDIRRLPMYAEVNAKKAQHQRRWNRYYNVSLQRNTRIGYFGAMDYL